VTDPRTFTAEHKSWQWDLVLRFEEGSLPATEWNETMLSTVANWYAKNLTREQATTRYQHHYQRNRQRLSNRREGASVATNAIEALDMVWESLLSRALDSAS
jgi:hypothetical protein